MKVFISFDGAIFVSTPFVSVCANDFCQLKIKNWNVEITALGELEGGDIFFDVSDKLDFGGFYVFDHVILNIHNAKIEIYKE